MYQAKRPVAAFGVHGFVLRRISAIERTVRHEWTDDEGKTRQGPTFHATLQEWERAHD